MVERNPYVILGIPFGADRDAATRAFARKAKGRRRQVAAASDLTELTWALNQVAEVVRDPRTALDIYRVPADASAFDRDGPGVLRPPPELMARRSRSSGPEWGRLLEAATDEALSVLQHQIASTAALPHR